MQKTELYTLGVMFDAEIEAALTHSKIGPLVQRRAERVFRRLSERGLCEKVVIEQPDLVFKDGLRIPMIIEGWRLTPLGHMTYCQEVGAKSA